MNTLFKALSHPVRRRIVAMLRAGPLASGDIAATFEPTQITDPDADLAPGQYRVLTTTLNDEDTTLPVETAAEANAS